MPASDFLFPNWVTINRFLVSNHSSEKIFFHALFPYTYCIQKLNVDNATARLLAIFFGSAYDDTICSEQDERINTKRNINGCAATQKQKV